MGKRFRLVIAFSILLLSISLFMIILDIKGGHDFGIFSSFWISVVAVLFSFNQLRKPLFLTGFVFLNTLVLHINLLRMRQAPWDPDAPLATGKVRMRLASLQFYKTRLLLSWDDPKKYSRAIEQRITNDLQGVTAALLALDMAYRLDGPGLLARKGGTVRGIQVTPRSELLAQANLTRFKMLFPQEIVANHVDFQPGEPLLEALSCLCSSIDFNPLCAEAFESGRLLMAHLHHEDIADAFQGIARHIVHAHEQTGS
ncbi:hypothetical protein [Tengunoibacter tsumagoiensis]|uniref:Uncharacterized protein n=1 Tax=Tengunoibacter tsumagoiensis TaxID=2014871 RepID=A0A402A761_9CHLR|nr:hypothetical protein [Tengunoibacter tsumagoiensis]GCE14974.1 hypothetical protein KTT_48330 [Tengunoibacter tsumagoiensis]